MSQEIDQFRRRFLGSAAMSLAAGHLGLIDVAHAQTANPTDDGVVIIGNGSWSIVGLQSAVAGFVTVCAAAALTLAAVTLRSALRRV